MFIFRELRSALCILFWFVNSNEWKSFFSPASRVESLSQSVSDTINGVIIDLFEIHQGWA